jgi:Tol biopolymer transport system component
VTRIKSLGWRTPNAIHSASVSPDGRFVTYAALTTNPDQPPTPQQSSELQRQVYVLPLDGSADEAALTSGSGIKNNLVWMPDGRHVLFTSNVTGAIDLWAAPVDDGKPAGQARLVRKDIGGIASLGMSSSGPLHYYEGRAGVIRTEFVNLNGGPVDRAAGGRPNPALDTKIRPLGLTAGEQVALVAFLRSLTGEVQEGWRR